MGTIIFHIIGMICTIFLSQYVSKKWKLNVDDAFQLTLMTLLGYACILMAPIRLSIVFMLMAGCLYLYEKLWKRK